MQTNFLQFQEQEELNVNRLIENFGMVDTAAYCKLRAHLFYSEKPPEDYQSLNMLKSLWYQMKYHSICDELRNEGNNFLHYRSNISSMSSIINDIAYRCRKHNCEKCPLGNYTKDVCDINTVRAFLSDTFKE